MGEITLITGGSRSGKSAFAQQLAEQKTGSRLFLATCPVTDNEMAARIQRHINDRQEAGWETVEEQVDVAGELARSSSYTIVLVDCLTLWVNNLMYEAERAGAELNEDQVKDKIEEIIRTVADHPGTVIFVTNEVGLGIVPGNETARLYRDLVGRCNQVMARAADKVYLVSCGIPLQLKGKK